MGVYKYNATDDELNPIAGATTFADCAIGSIIPFGGNTIPKSFLLCDGAEVSKTEYADLYAVIGDAFGTATEATNFRLPDLRECAPVGAGKNITQSIGSHDRFNLGQFKDDQLQNFVISQGTRYQSNTASAGDGFIEGRVDGGTIQIKSENATTGRFGDVTRGKRLGVNFIIKAKHSAYPADMKQAVEEVMEDYQTKDLATPLSIGGVSKTTVEDALSALNSIDIPQFYYNANTDVNVLSDRQNAIAYVFTNIIPSAYFTQGKFAFVKIRYTGGAYLSYIFSKNTDSEISVMEVHEYEYTINTWYGIYDNSTWTFSLKGMCSRNFYSTSETLTNKVWIDGKPIYRKVVETGTLPNNTVKYVAHGISNLSKVVSLTGMASNASYSLALPHISNSNFSVEVEIEGANIDISTLSNMSGYTSSFVVIEYTKTTS